MSGQTFLAVIWVDANYRNKDTVYEFVGSYSKKTDRTFVVQVSNN